MTAALPEATPVEPAVGSHALLAQSSTTDIAGIVFMAVAVFGFIAGLLNMKRSNPTDRINDLIQQRNEADADLVECERRCRALERALSKLENGNGK
jgi:hypothetical protein